MARILLFAKAPHPGLAKTRLIPALGAEGAAELARRLLQHTVEAAMGADVGEVELLLTPAYPAPQWQGVRFPETLLLSDQGEGDLGQRMARAAQRSQDPMLLIGTDCVEMCPLLLQEAAAALTQHQAVLYPAADGGYALLGLQHFHATLFTEIAWSSATVAATTLARLHHLDWSVQVGRTLHDLDTPDDLRQLMQGTLLA
ncbi:MAG: TIGR04282 family arsenosugar biosynthesis glycosyltransferase [Magnetococcales bacterium]|nr:TIGR04282 family arsenosugar biosynthesis glycosyltransferase [Magnetococcales bacterium]MBF0113992.1 TIGR04282 family arsenosugar biosynthesis glycosyltransferase [Magnetococcales bacterium]